MSGLFGDWEKAERFLKDMSRNAGTAADKAVRDEAFVLLRLVKDAFPAQGVRTAKKWKPLSALTIELRKQAGKLGGTPTKGTKALIRTGSLRRSFVVEKKGDARYRSGLTATRRARAASRWST